MLVPPSATRRGATGPARFPGLAGVMALTRHRHSLAVMALLHRGQGAKFVTLVNRSRGSRAAVRQALDHLMEVGWVRRPPGHGHPLRPEYELTPDGQRTARACASLDAWLARRGNDRRREILVRRWPLPVLAAMISGSVRFSDLARRLPGLTDRALSLALASLVEAGLAARDVLDSHPPAVRYRPTRAGRALPALRLMEE